MKDIIIFAGAPGSGKTTISEMLREKLNSPLIDFGSLRVWHLDRAWSNASAKEEQMAFENLVFVLRNYLKNGYTNVICNNLKDERIKELTEIFKDSDVLVISLIVTDDDVLKTRVTGERDSGFKDAEAALALNRKTLERAPYPNESRIDTTRQKPEETFVAVLSLIGT